MAKVQRKPPVFDALQFTGGQANAKTIVEGAAALAPTYIVRYQPATSEYGLLNGVVTEFKIPERLRVESMVEQTVVYATLGQWLMVSSEGVIDILANDRFTALFQSV